MKSSVDMKEIKLNTNELSTVASELKAGARVILSGTV